MLKISTVIKNKIPTSNVMFRNDKNIGANLIYFPEFSIEDKGIKFIQKYRKKNFWDYIIIPPAFNFMGKKVFTNVYFKDTKKFIPQVRVQKKFMRVQKEQQSVIVDLTPLSELFANFVKTRSKRQTIESFLNLVEAFAKDSKVAAPEKDVYLIIDNNDTTTDDFAEAFLYYSRMMQNKIRLENIDAVVFIGANRFWPVTITEEDKDGRYLKININIITRFFKEVHNQNITQEEIDPDEEIKNIKNDIDILHNLHQVQQKSLKNETTSKIQGDELNEHPVEAIKHILNTSKVVKGKTVEEKLKYVYDRHSSIITKEQSESNDKKEKEKLQKTVQKNSKAVEEISKNIKELNKKYNGVITVNPKSVETAADNYYDPIKVIGFNDFHAYGRQSTEFDQNLDEAMYDLIKSLEADKDLGIKILGISSEITDNYKDRFKTFRIKIQHKDFGNTKPYTVKFHVPYPAQGKYLKLNAGNYIMTNQFFPKPVIKVKPNTVRIYTHYSTAAITLKSHSITEQKDQSDILINFKKKLDSLKKLKSSMSYEVDEINFFKEKYDIPKSVPVGLFFDAEVVSDGLTYKIDFGEGIKKNPNVDGPEKLKFYQLIENGKVIEYAYISPTSDDVHYKTKEGDENHFPKAHMTEFIMNLWNNFAKEHINSRIDLKSKSSRPYFGLRMQAKEIALIHFFIMNKGLLDSLDFLGIKYQYAKVRNKDALLNLKIEDSKAKYLAIFSKSLTEEYFINGLRIGASMVFPVSKKKLNDPDLYNPYFELKGSDGRYVKKTREATNSFIDNTTSKILKTYNIPTDIYELFGKYVPKFLLNAEVEVIEDLSTQRIRMSEAISHAGYKMLQKAAAKLKRIKNSGKAYDAELELHPYFITQEMMSSGMFQFTQSTNPLEELLLSSKITKTGIGNMKKEQVTLPKRDLNRSYFGTIAATTTNEYSGIGLNQTLTNKATIKDRFGSIQIKSFTNDRNPFENLSATESLLPFYEYDDTTRRVMGNQQFSQFVQLDNPDEPLVQTGFESIVPHIVSDRFAVKAKIDGRVKSIDSEYINVVGKDGELIRYNIKEKRSRTKRGIYMPLKYNIMAKVGQKVFKGDVLAATNSLKTGKMSPGKNLVVALMSYRGMNYEDGWVVSNKLVEKFTNKIHEKITILVPTGAKIKDDFLTVGRETKPGDILCSYYKDSNFNLEDYNDDSDSGEAVLTGVEFSGNNVIYRSMGGTIKDIVIRINDKNIDKKVLEKWNSATKGIREKLKECELFKHNHKRYADCTSNVENTQMLVIGGHKVNGHEFEGAVIEVYIEGNNKIRSGSKFTLGGTGGKGTIQYMIPKGKDPRAVETKLDIEFIPTPVSIISRKNPSIILNLYSGKVVYYLNKKVKELINTKQIDKARQLLLSVLGAMDASPDQFIINEIMGFFDSKSTQEIIKYVNQSDPLNKPAFPLLVPPHKNKITVKNIEEAAKILGIPLDEKVYIPEEDIYTDRPVPVGILQIYYLEHFPKTMSSTRGSLKVKRQFTTGQGRSGTKVGNGAIKLGLYDLFSLSTRKPGYMLKELHGMRSDNQEGSRKLMNMVMKTGLMPKTTDIKVDSNQSKTKQLIEAYFIGAILEPEL